MIGWRLIKLWVAVPLLLILAVVGCDDYNKKHGDYKPGLICIDGQVFKETYENTHSARDRGTYYPDRFTL